MNDRFNMKYVRESIELFFNKTIIEHSSNTSQHIFNHDNEHNPLKNFSVSHHAVFIVLKFLSVFSFNKSSSVVAAQLLEIVDGNSQFSSHFTAFYSKTQYQIERSILYLLILTLVKVGQIKDDEGEIAKTKLKNLEKEFVGQVDKVKVKLDCMGLGSEYLETQFLIPVTKDILAVFKHAALAKYIDQLAKSAKLKTLQSFIKENAQTAGDVTPVKENREGDAKPVVSGINKMLVEENLLHVTSNAKSSKIDETPTIALFQARKRKNSKESATPKKAEKTAVTRSDETKKDRKALFFENFIKDSKSDSKGTTSISPFDPRAKAKPEDAKRHKNIQKLTSQLSMIPKTKQAKSRVIKSAYTDKYLTKKKQSEEEYVINLRNVSGNENFSKLYSDVMTHNSFGELDCFNDFKNSELTKPDTAEKCELGFNFCFDENQQSIQFTDLCNEVQGAKTPIKTMLTKFNSG